MHGQANLKFAMKKSAALLSRKNWVIQSFLLVCDSDYLVDVVTL
jgi:hypothetical protein